MEICSEFSKCLTDQGIFDGAGWGRGSNGIALDSVAGKPGKERAFPAPHFIPQRGAELLERLGLIVEILLSQATSSLRFALFSICVH